MRKPVPNKKGVWYHISWSECPLCGVGDEYRERRLGPKPKNPAKRYEELPPVACGSHFL